MLSFDRADIPPYEYYEDYNISSNIVETTTLPDQYLETTTLLKQTVKTTTLFEQKDIVIFSFIGILVFVIICLIIALVRKKYIYRFEIIKNENDL